MWYQSRSYQIRIQLIEIWLFNLNNWFLFWALDLKKNDENLDAISSSCSLCLCCIYMCSRFACFLIKMSEILSNCYASRFILEESYKDKTYILLLYYNLFVNISVYIIITLLNACLLLLSGWRCLCFTLFTLSSSFKSTFMFFFFFSSYIYLCLSYLHFVFIYIYIYILL